MSVLDTYFRAFTKYRKETQDNRELIGSRRDISKVNNDACEIKITRVVCDIDEEWVNEIETGLEYIEKAIKEDRQFIQANGEVLPVEKVKHVSKDTVKHLAKHTDLLSKDSTEDDVLPNKLYTVEKYSDYTVYENRFLYMLLSYLRDFVTIRYAKIMEVSNTYNGALNMKKIITKSHHKLEYTATLTEQLSEDEFLAEINPAKETISRIGLILKSIMSLLQTPLMQEVSKVAMLKPPITKTNVLKMNNNFKNAMALYDFIISYTKDGYEIREEVKSLNPFDDDVNDDFAEVILLNSFLTYQYGLGIKEQLQANFDIEEQRLKDAEVEALAVQIQAMKRRVKESGQDIDEYMLMLEKRNKALEGNITQLDLAHQEVDQLNSELDEMTKELNKWKDAISQTQKLIADAKAEAQEEIKRMRVEIMQEAEEAQEEAEQSIQEKDEEVAMMRRRFEQQKQDIQKELADARGANQYYIDQKDLIEARYNALCKEHGLAGTKDVYASKEEFEQLEHQYKMFEEYFKSEWKKTKKAIKKSILHSGKKGLIDIEAIEVQNGLRSPSDVTSSDTVTLAPAKDKSKKKQKQEVVAVEDTTISEVDEDDMEEIIVEETKKESVDSKVSSEIDMSDFE